MENEIKLDPQELQIQGILDRYLTSGSNRSAADGRHIDDDSLSAFVEGTLNRRESDSIVTHLVDCGFCRHTTSELVRLDLAFAEEAPAQIAANAEHSKISDVLSGIFSKIFGTTDGAVFAHEEKEKEKEENERAVGDEKIEKE
ncbi:MAG: hypothetical protein PSX80_04945 [bacterium]|nr:hypothetical protein [bacterium]